MSERPVVGITCYVTRARWGPWDVPAALTPWSYVAAVEGAGGRAVLLPPSENAAELVRLLDAVVLAGGPDLDPRVYGAEPHPEAGPFDARRDRGEQALLEAALRRDLPVLAVCRGMQLLNVARGGDLVQHLPDGQRLHRDRPGCFVRHRVRVAAGSRLAEIAGSEVDGASHHHQAVGRLGAGLRPVAWADDGVVEAVEDPERAFLFGVLWHAEEDGAGPLFAGLVEAAGHARRQAHEG